MDRLALESAASTHWHLVWFLKMTKDFLSFFLPIALVRTANLTFSSSDSTDLHTAPGFKQQPVDLSHRWITKADGV